jgi:hypothetical protein
MHLPRVDFIGPDIVPAAAMAVVTNSNGRKFAAEAMNAVPFDEDAYRYSDTRAEPEAQLHCLVTLFE